MCPTLSAHGVFVVGSERDSSSRVESTTFLWNDSPLRPLRRTSGVLAMRARAAAHTMAIFLQTNRQAARLYRLVLL